MFIKPFIFGYHSIHEFSSSLDLLWFPASRSPPTTNQKSISRKNQRRNWQIVTKIMTDRNAKHIKTDYILPTHELIPWIWSYSFLYHITEITWSNTLLNYLSHQYQILQNVLRLLYVWYRRNQNRKQKTNSKRKELKGRGIDNPDSKIRHSSFFLLFVVSSFPQTSLWEQKKSIQEANLKYPLQLAYFYFTLTSYKPVKLMWYHQFWHVISSLF